MKAKGRTETKCEKDVEGQELWVKGNTIKDSNRKAGRIRRTYRREVKNREINEMTDTGNEI